MSNFEIIVIVLCAFGFGYSCWKAGLKSGAEKTLDILRDKKIICYDHKGDVKPNLFWQEEDKDEE